MKKVCKLVLSRKFTYCLSAVAFSLIAFSCKEEANSNSENFTGEEQEIVLSLDVPTVNEATQLRSIGLTEENTIKTIDLIAFRKDNTGSYFNYSYTGVLAADNTPGQSSQKCRVKVRLAKYEQEFVIITNAGTQVSNLLKSQNWQNVLKETFLAKLEYALSRTGTVWNAVGASNYDALPMWGETTTMITQNTTQLSASLLRMLAKIDVQLDETKPALKNVFKLKSTRLYNTYTKGRIVPNNSFVQQVGNNVKVTAPTLPAAAEKYLGPLVYQDFTSPGILDAAMKGAIYTFETQAPEAGNLYGPLDATCIVVGGIYGTDAKETYYRIDFQKDGKFQDILRNHRYLVNIISVTGSGYETPDEAFHNQSVNLDANILVWDESNMYDVTFDGQWYLSVSRDSIFFPLENDTNTDLFVKTDYNPSGSLQTGWYIESIIDSATQATATWLTAIPMSGSPNELKNVKLITTDNNSGKLRKAVIMFVAGRLHYPVIIRQTLLPKASISLRFESYGSEPAAVNPDVIIFPVTLGVKNNPRKFTVEWTPNNAELVVYKSTVAGVQYSEFDLSPNIAGVIGNSGFPLTVSVTPNATVFADMLPYFRASRLVFSVTNGLNTVEKTVILEHVYNNGN